MQIVKPIIRFYNIDYIFTSITLYRLYCIASSISYRMPKEAEVKAQMSRRMILMKHGQ